jgi:hypothetical protein
LANCVLLTQAEAREYHQLDFEDWITTRSEAWLEKHMLPNNFSLYNERCFLDFIHARTKLIATRIVQLFDWQKVTQITLDRESEQRRVPGSI